MSKKEFIVVSDYDGLELKGIIYEPMGKAKGIVQITHGMCEYKERYIDFMRFLSGNGYIAACYDQRGHGDSVKSEEDLGWFGDAKAKAIVDDAVQVTRYLKSQYPDIPLTLFGHSMGSMVVRCYLHEHDTEIEQLIVCGSPSKNPLAGIAIGLTKCISLFRGARHRSKMLSYLSTGKGDKLFKGEGKGAWLSQNRKCTEKFYANPKGKHKFTCNGFENLFRLMKGTYQKQAYQVRNETLPILFISGDRDAVIGDPYKWQKSMDVLIEVGYQNVVGKLYTDLRHEILNEYAHQQVYRDVLGFLKLAKLPEDGWQVFDETTPKETSETKNA
ncbi:MAG: alpha/beta fold hydrolase [Clostridia bacterium]|nr:alpha/beta fold hydrolase [Clostridia bacterium]